MKVSAFLFMFLAVLALFVGSSTAAPKLNVGAIKKGGKVIRKGFGVLSAAGTAHEVYNHVKNRRN
ncbi:virescein-like [Papilio machaon]|uniref:virescein-like n=1 Tax=Papilio machaon TaxID=76193 RepID=UPI001E662A93|nr:virescein-like [Papilio machaon]